MALPRPLIRRYTIVLFIYAYILAYKLYRAQKQRLAVRFNDPSHGERYVASVIEQAHPRRCIEVFRMPLETFLSLSAWLEDYAGLRSQGNVSARQQLAMFMAIAGHGRSMRHVAEQYWHSTETVFR
jgi:hypothetical protein